MGHNEARIIGGQCLWLLGKNVSGIIRGMCQMFFSWNCRHFPDMFSPHRRFWSNIMCHWNLGRNLNIEYSKETLGKVGTS